MRPRKPSSRPSATCRRLAYVERFDAWPCEEKPDSMGWGRNAFVPDVYVDACGSEGTQAEVGPSGQDLAQALLDQEASGVSEPVDLTVGGYSAVRSRSPSRPIST